MLQLNRKIVAGRGIVFVGGPPRSGTTLMQRIIGSNSDVFAGPEFDHIPIGLFNLREKMIQSLKSGRIDAIVDETTLNHAVHNFVSTIFEERLRRTGRVVFCEKTPANALAFSEMEKVFPEARYIMMVRDPRSIVCSMKVVRKKFLTKGQRPPKFVRSIAASIEEINRYYKAGFNAAEQSDKILLVYYEDLTSEPSRQVQRVCEHIGVTYQPKMLSIEETDLITLQTGDDNWYSQADLQKPIQKTGVVSRGASLTPAESALVERFTIQYPALARYQLKPGAPTTIEKLMWRASILKKLGLFLPR